MARQRSYGIGEVARISGVTVRTLHHYDDIGLLVPAQRTDAGYRRYDDADLLRLQEILLGREQGLSLEDIRTALDDPHHDRRQALREHRRRLIERARRTDAMVRAVDTALAMLEGDEGGSMSGHDFFNGFNPAQYEDEAKERWGETDAYRESAKRTKRYGPSQWGEIKDEQAAIYADALAALQAGVAADAPEAMAIAERHRRSIERWFYPCSTEMHTGLADLWEADERYAASMDAHGAGITAFLAAAVRANARQHAA